VAIGMSLAFALSAELGLAPAADAARLTRHLAAMGLPTTINEISWHRFTPEILMTHMMQDKKKAGGKLGLVLVRGIGQAFVTRDVEPAALRDFLAKAVQPPVSAGKGP